MYSRKGNIVKIVNDFYISVMNLIPIFYREIKLLSSNWTKFNDKMSITRFLKVNESQRDLIFGFGN